MQLQELLSKINIQHRFVLFAFYADWFIPCSMILKDLDDVLFQSKLPLEYSKVNVDESLEITEKYKIRTIPTILLFQNGEVLIRKEGINVSKELNDFIKKALSNAN
jgi:thioredoxin 1